VDNDQRQMSGKTATGSGYRLTLVAAAIVTLWAALYIAYEPASLSLGSFRETARCDEDQDSCALAAADDDNRSTPGAYPANGGRKSANAGLPNRHASRPRGLPQEPFNAEALRPGYTMAELCLAGLDDQPYRCQTGSYDGKFSVSEPGGVTERGSSAGTAISGRVLTTEGVGLRGVTIVAAPERLAASQETVSGTLRFWTVTDALGAYKLDGIPDGEYSIRSQSNDRYPSARISARSGVDYADLVVAANVATVAEGRVLDSAGGPLEGVTVLPVLQGQASVLTGKDGRFRLPVRTKPAVEAIALRFQLPGFHEQTGKFSVPRDDASSGATMKVVMHPVEAWTSVKGRVSGDDGEPLAGLTVELRPQSAPRSYKSVTDRKGHYAFPVVEAQADYRLIVFGGAGHKDYQQSLHVTADMGDLDIVAESYEFGEVTGQLVNLSGEPVPEFGLLLRNTASQTASTLVSTDQHGNFAVTAAPAGRLVLASQSTPAMLVEGLELKPGEKLHLPLVLDWGQHEIRGVVVNARGLPVPASRILLQWSHQSDGITVKTTRRTAADAQGHFAFSHLGPGTHSLQVDAAGFPRLVVDHDVTRQGYDLMVKLN